MSETREMQMCVKLLLVLGLTVSSAGCDLFEGDDDEPVVPSSIVVLNGGNFGDQNGYLTVYDAETGMTSDLADLGAFGHSVSVRGNRAYVSLNTFTTGRIDVVDLNTSQVIQQIDAPAPRSIAFVDDQTVLATNLSVFGAEGPEPGIVSRISLSGGSSDPFATVGLYPEGIVIIGGKAYVANSGSLGDSRTLSVVDLSDGSEDRIDLGCDGPNEIFVDGGGELAVVCAGKTVYNDDFTEILEETNGQVLFLDAASSQIVDRIELNLKPVSASEAQTAFYDDASGDLFVTADPTDEILRFDTDRNELESRLDVPDQEDLIGIAAVAYDPATERLYVARLAKGPGGFADFTSSGAVLVLDEAGALVDRFSVGPSPTHIAILEAGSP